MSNTTYTTNIEKFNFAEAKFDDLPPEIFQTDPGTLSPSDRVILDAIKFQMTVSKANAVMQKVNYDIIKQKTLIGKQIAGIRDQLSGTKNYELRIRNYVFDVGSDMLHNSYFIIQTPAQLVQTVYSGVAFTIILFVFVSFAYYANVNLNLGMNFLTNLFA